MLYFCVRSGHALLLAAQYNTLMLGLCIGSWISTFWVINKVKPMMDAVIIVPVKYTSKTEIEYSSNITNNVHDNHSSLMNADDDSSIHLLNIPKLLTFGTDSFVERNEHKIEDSSVRLSLNVDHQMKRRQHLIKKNSDLSIEIPNDCNHNKIISFISASYSASPSFLKHKLKNVQLLDILQHSKSFELFMRQLSDEFSMECLLSLVEFVQFQKYMECYLQSCDGYSSEEMCNKIADIMFILLLKNTNEKKEIDDGEYFYKLIAFPETIPKSIIVYTNVDVDEKKEIFEFLQECKTKAYNLYLKYVRNGAEYEINIDSKARNLLIMAMHNYEQWMMVDEHRGIISDENHNLFFDLFQLQHIFDRCCQEMYQLLQSSFLRFKNTPQFEKLKTHSHLFEF